MERGTDPIEPAPVADSAEGSSAAPRVAASEEPGRWVVPALLLLALLASLIHLQPEVYDPSLSTGDGAVYVVCARNMLAGEGYSYLGEPFTIRPPGFSILLLAPLALVGPDLNALALFVGLFGALAVLLLFLYQRPRLGTPLAAAVAIAIWTNPGFLRSAGQIMSDVPGLALMLACLLLERWARRKPSLGRDVLLGLAIGASAWVRSMNVLLAPALVAGRLFTAFGGREKRGGLAWPRFVLLRLFVPAGIALLCMVPWNLRNAGIEGRVPSEDTLFYSYSSAMWHQDWGDPGSPRITLEKLLERVERRKDDLLHVLGSRMQDRSDEPVHRTLALFGLACAAGVLVIRRGTGDFMLAGMVSVIAIYFGFMNRLVLPVYVLVLPAVAQVIVWALRRPLGAQRAGIVCAVLVLGLAAFDFHPRWGFDQREARHAEWVQACTLVEAHADADDVVAANFGAHYSLALDRPVLTLRWAEKRSGVDGALEFALRRQVDLLLLDAGLPDEARLLSKLRRDGHEVVERRGLFSLVRLTR